MWIYTTRRMQKITIINSKHYVCLDSGKSRKLPNPEPNGVSIQMKVLDDYIVNYLYYYRREFIFFHIFK